MTSVIDTVRRDAISKFPDGILSEEEQQILFEAIKTIEYLCNLARKEGLLALEEAGLNLSKDTPRLTFLQNAINLIVDGTDPELIEEILTTLYWVDAKQPTDALVTYVYLRGTLALQMGLNPRIIRDILIALLPEDYRNKCVEYVEIELEKQKQEEKKQNWEKYEKLSISFDNAEIQKYAKELEYNLKKMSDKSIQRLLRDVDNYDLAYTMLALPKNAHEYILHNVSPRLRDILIESIVRKSAFHEGLYSACESLAKQSPDKITYILQELQDTGEILIL